MSFGLYFETGLGRCKSNTVYISRKVRKDSDRETMRHTEIHKDRHRKTYGQTDRQCHRRRIYKNM